MKERVSRSRTPQKVPPETARSQGVEEELGGVMGRKEDGQEACPSALRRPGVPGETSGPLGAPGSTHSAPSWVADQAAPTARVRVLSLPLVFSPHRLQGKRKQALSARDVTSQRPPVTLSTPYSLARDLGLSKHQPERPPCSGPKPAVLWQRASS